MLNTGEPLDKDRLSVGVFPPFSRQGFLEEEKTNVPGTHACRHLVQVEVKISKIKLWEAPRTSFTSPGADKVITD